MVNLTMLLFIIILIRDNRTLIDEFRKRLMTPILTNFVQSYAKYFIPIKIRAPLIFAHLVCAKIKGSKFAQYESAKIKGRSKSARINEKRQLYSKIRVCENEMGAKSEGARKLEARKSKGREF